MTQHQARSTRGRARSAALVTAIVAAILLAAPATASAETFVVETTLDPGAMVVPPWYGCSSPDPDDPTRCFDSFNSCTLNTTESLCGLRDAIAAANESPGPDVVLLPSGSYSLTYGTLHVEDDLLIERLGDGVVTIDGGGDTGFWGVIRTLADVTIRNVTITGGSGSRGGGVHAGGGSLLLEHVVVTGNTTWNGGGGVHVGSFASARLVRTSVTQNATGGDGGGIEAWGALELAESSVAGNTAGSTGGGVVFEGSSLLVGGSTISGNTAQTGGGLAITSAESALVRNTTISGNTAEWGGGAYLESEPLLAHVTIAANTADEGGGIANNGYPELRSSIVAGNGGGDCLAWFDFRELTSLGGNLDGDGSCDLGHASDKSAVNPQLGPLADNGGPTWTHALAASSPAVDAAFGSCPATDQRGIARPQGAACDSGAYERVVVSAPDPGPTARERLDALRTAVSVLAVQPSGIRTALLAKLDAAAAALDRGDVPAACSALQDFVNQVKAQSGKKLPASTASALIAQAQVIRQALGCA